MLPDMGQKSKVAASKHQLPYRFHTVVPVFKIQGVSQVAGAGIWDARLAWVFVDAFLTALINLLRTFINVHAVLPI